MSPLTSEKQPPLYRWDQISTQRMPLGPNFLAVSAWQRGPVRVISALENAELPDGSGEVGPQWHVSVSRAHGRPRPGDVEMVLRDFDMVGTEEDNHHPGAARHFWLPVDPARRVECECKQDETVVVEPDGYRWTNAKEGECRGCELARILPHLPCSIHAARISP